MSLVELLKKGNQSAAAAALGNAIIAVSKGTAAWLSGSGAMLATTIHSIADTLNQAFVFAGSILAEKRPTKRFPAGFGRVVNLFVLIAVIIISIMAYETIKEGWHLIQHPEPSQNLLLNVVILVLAVVIDGYVLFKAMKEIVKETGANATGWQTIRASFQNVGLASPPTRLVFYEDILATFSAMLALMFIFLADLTGVYILDGIGTLLIGSLLIGIAIKIGYENTIGLIGVAAPKVIQERIAKIILDDPDVVDIKKMRILQEGRKYHVEVTLNCGKDFPLL
ncbi:cation diffusion facilitator family transporter [Melghirimyces profundicolus]|uniref:Cation diffusion facilitator family transporter n=1 Tax=Melghirimyces profundicolus TaxID=1242148 RepID=A0A2T6BW61_9BACL|nr:cation diffusion facilitator family transporter [Melghirimyces profundicolus]